MPRLPSPSYTKVAFEKGGAGVAVGVFEAMGVGVFVGVSVAVGVLVGPLEVWMTCCGALAPDSQS